MKKSIGVKIFSLLAILLTLFYLGKLIYIFVKFPTKFPIYLVVYGFAYGLLILVAAIGFFLLKNWARILFILISLVKLGQNVFYIFSSNFQINIFLLEKFTNIAIIVAILFFLLKNSTKKQFIPGLNSN